MEHSTRILQLSDARRIAFDEYGDPSGVPVFYAHGTPGSRLEGLRFDQSARCFGIRLICMDRPGIGGSDYRDGYCLRDFPFDVTALADHLGLDRFGVLGWSSGGPHALACAHSVPERLRFVVVLASYTNFAEYRGARRLLWEHHQFAPTIALKSHLLFRSLLELLRAAERHMPRLYLEFVKRSATVRDLQVLQQPEIVRDFMRNQDEAFRQGIDGVMRDLYSEYIEWGFRLADVRFPVHIIQGRQDQFVPWQFAEHLAANLPSAKLNYLDSEGHLFPLDSMWQRRLWMRIRGLSESVLSSKPAEPATLAAPELRREQNQYRKHLESAQQHSKA